MSNSQISLGTFLTTALLAMAMLVGLGEFYTYSIGRLHVKPWIGVLAAHTVMSFVLILIRKPVHCAFYQQTFALTLTKYCRHPAPLNWRASICVLTQRWFLFVLAICSSSAVFTLLVSGLGSRHSGFAAALVFRQFNYHLLE